MKFKKKTIYGLVVGVGSVIASMLYPFIPCKNIPNVPNPSSSYTLCSLKPSVAGRADTFIEYFGYTDSIFLAYATTFILSFLFVFFLFHFIHLKNK